MYLYMYFILHCQNSKTTFKLPENSRKSVLRIIFNGALCEVRAYYNVTISYRQSTRIRYQKNYLGKLLFITKMYTVNAT